MRARSWWLMATAAAVAACSEVGPEVGSPSFNHFGNPAEGHFVLCKSGTDATFDIVVDGTPSTVSLLNGECRSIAEVTLIPGSPSPNLTVTVTENVPSGTQLVRFVVDSILKNGTTFTYAVTGTNTLTRTFRDDIGFRVTFENTLLPPPPGGQGCTPGFWKNHLAAWGPTGYSPGDDFDAVFGTSYFNPDITLQQAVNLGGGGLRKVARHGTAALLNAAHPSVSYALTVAQVIAAVQSGNVDALVAFNERETPGFCE